MDEPRDKMEKVLTHLVSFLSKSEPSAYASQTPSELVKNVALNLKSVKSTGLLSNPELMVNMFSPTASLQEIAMDNGWGNEYIELSKHFEIALRDCK